jgi:hypothetical protein
MPGDNRSCLNSRSDSGCLYPRSGRSLQGRAPFAFELDAKPVEGLDLRMDLISWHVDIERNENKAGARLVRLLCREDESTTLAIGLCDMWCTFVPEVPPSHQSGD